MFWRPPTPQLQYICNTFNTNHDIHNHNTINASLRVIKHVKARTAYYHGGFAVYDQRLWNDLPNNIKLAHLYIVLQIPCTSI